MADGQGAIQVQGSTSGYFYVLNDAGDQLGYQSFNHSVPVVAGEYEVVVNQSRHVVLVRDGELTKCSTGTLMVTGSTDEYFHVADTSGQAIASGRLGQSLSLFPGEYTTMVNQTEVKTMVKPRELTEVKTGTLLVRGSTPEYYYVLDQSARQLNNTLLGRPLAFLPGTYPVKVNKTTINADILPGQVTELVTGTVLVKGLTEEYYYVTDSLGNALNYQILNKPLAFFPGHVHVQINNTRRCTEVAAGQTIELITGSLMLRGTGNEYYYVLDSIGNALNYNSLNRSLSFFPSEYTVRLGSDTSKATVVPGTLTSLDVTP